MMTELFKSAKELMPTDNLYKFMTIFGLVLTVSSLVSFAIINNKNQELQYRSVVEMARTKIELDIAEREYNSALEREKRYDEHVKEMIAPIDSPTTHPTTTKITSLSDLDDILRAEKKYF